MLESKSSALPLGDTPIFNFKSIEYTMVRLKGVEPLAHGLEGRCSILLSYRRTIFVERVKGIGPSQPAWKAGALPLSYTRKIIYASFVIFLERKTRFELATLALARRCSTTEPLPHILLYVLVNKLCQYFI